MHSLIITGGPLVALQQHATTFATSTDQLLHVEQHPNTTGTKTGIYIEDIRELQIATRSQRQHGRTLVVISDAATMTTQAQNALLKILEEPRPGLQLILCTPTPDLLLATVRSRCQIVTIHALPNTPIELPAETGARIRFMSDGDEAEIKKLAKNSKYYESRLVLFEQAKKFIGSTPYERAALVSRVATKRPDALEFIDACLVIYRTLIKTRYSDTLRDEANTLIETYDAIKANANAKLQLLNFVVQ